MKPKVSHRKLHSKKAPELALLAENVGRFIEYWGFKGVQGRLWLYLFVSKEPLSSIELSDLLDVSPALVTQSVQVLLDYKVILLAPKGPNGVLRYQANPNVAEAIRTVLETRETKLLEETRLQVKKAKSETRKPNELGIELNIENLEKISSWIELFQMVLHLGISSLGSSETPFSNPALFSKQVDQMGCLVDAERLKGKNRK